MGIFYLVPAAVLWLAYGIGALALNLPWWIDYPLFGAACAATGVGLFVAVLASAGARW